MQFDLAQLEKMIDDNVTFWAKRAEGIHAGDLAAEEANQLPRHQVEIAKEYVALVKAVRDYLLHPSEDGSPLRREKRRGLAAMVADKE